MTPPTSRTQAARRRAVGAKRTAATAAAAGFLAIAVLASGSHPGLYAGSAWLVFALLVHRVSLDWSTAATTLRKEKQWQ